MSNTFALLAGGPLARFEAWQRNFRNHTAGDGATMTPKKNSTWASPGLLVSNWRGAESISFRVVFWVELGRVATELSSGANGKCAFDSHPCQLSNRDAAAQPLLVT